MNTTNHTSPIGEDAANGGSWERADIEWLLKLAERSAHDGDLSIARVRAALTAEGAIGERPIDEEDAFQDWWKTRKGQETNAYHGWMARAALAAEKVAAEPVQFPTPISISTDKICEIAGKYNLGNPRLDALRGFVNEIIIANEAEYEKSE